jgi:hypothetical protein
MKLPVFVKQLARICDGESSGYALGSIQCKSDGKSASMAATDGRILATVHWHDEDGIEVDALAHAKDLAAPPVKAFAHPLGVRFEGHELRGGAKGAVAINTSGRFPNCEGVMRIHDEPDGYTSVKLDAALLGKLCSLSHAMNDDTAKGKGIVLFVKDAASCVYAATQGEDGHVARFAIMPLAADDGVTSHVYPARPGSLAPKPEPADKPARKSRTRPAEPARKQAAAPAAGHDFSVALPALA